MRICFIGNRKREDIRNLMLEISSCLNPFQYFSSLDSLHIFLDFPINFTKSRNPRNLRFSGSPNTNKGMFQVEYLHFHITGGRFRTSQRVIEVDLSAGSDRAPQIHRGSDFCHSLRLIPTSVLQNLRLILESLNFHYFCEWNCNFESFCSRCETWVVWCFTKVCEILIFHE